MAMIYSFMLVPNSRGNPSPHPRERRTTGQAVEYATERAGVAAWKTPAEVIAADTLTGTVKLTDCLDVPLIDMPAKSLMSGAG